VVIGEACRLVDVGCSVFNMETTLTAVELVSVIEKKIRGEVRLLRLTAYEARRAFQQLPASK
jgi:hypothetical protein